MGLGVAVMYAYYSTVYSTIQDIIEPSLRGTAMALYFFAMYVWAHRSGLSAQGWQASTSLLALPAAGVFDTSTTGA